MINQKYILKGKKLVKADLITWAKWFETTDRHVALTQVGKKEVSTVFLGIDHNWGKGAPHLFETMIFPDAKLYGRYPTWEKAKEGHKKCVEELEKKYKEFQ